MSSPSDILNAFVTQLVKGERKRESSHTTLTDIGTEEEKRNIVEEKEKQN